MEPQLGSDLENIGFARHEDRLQAHACPRLRSRLTALARPETLIGNPGVRS